MKKNKTAELVTILRNGDAQYSASEVYNAKSVYEQLATIECESKSGNIYKAMSYRTFYTLYLFFEQVLHKTFTTSDNKPFVIKSLVKDMDTPISFGKMCTAKGNLQKLIEAGEIQRFAEYAKVEIKSTTNSAFVSLDDLALRLNK